MKISNRELRRMMKRMGLTMEQLSNVSHVDIVLDDGNIIRINNPVVAKVKVSGQTTYQITGEEELIEKDVEVEVSEEDIEIVAQSAGVDKELARKALELTGGDIAQAIVLLKESNLLD